MFLRCAYSLGSISEFFFIPRVLLLCGACGAAVKMLSFGLSITPLLGETTEFPRRPKTFLLDCDPFSRGSANE